MHYSWSPREEFARLAVIVWHVFHTSYELGHTVVFRARRSRDRGRDPEICVGGSQCVWPPKIGPYISHEVKRNAEDREAWRVVTRQPSHKKMTHDDDDDDDDD